MEKKIIRVNKIKCRKCGDANVYTFALLTGNEWIYCTFYC